MSLQAAGTSSEASSAARAARVGQAHHRRGTLDVAQRPQRIRAVKRHPAVPEHRGEGQVKALEVDVLGAQHDAQRHPDLLARGAVDLLQAPHRHEQLPHPHPRALGAQHGGEVAELLHHGVGQRLQRDGRLAVERRRGRPERAPQTPSSTPRSRTRSTSSWTFRATPRVSSKDASSPSASSAWAHTIVSPTPGSL